MQIILMRHGQCEYNVAGLLNGQKDSPLTTEGEYQAVRAAWQLKKIVQPQAIYCSPLRRAARTAERVAIETGFPREEIVKLDDLKERCFGILEGEPYETIKQFDNRIPVGKFEVLLEGPGIECFSPELYERAQRALDFIKSRHNGEAVLMVSHGDTIKMLMAAHSKRPWMDVVKEPYFGNCEYRFLD